MVIHHWLIQLLVARSVSSHLLKQYWVIVNNQKQTSAKICIKIQNILFKKCMWISFKKCIWIWHLQNDIYFIQVSTCYFSTCWCFPFKYWNLTRFSTLSTWDWTHFKLILVLGFPQLHVKPDWLVNCEILLASLQNVMGSTKHFQSMTCKESLWKTYVNYILSVLCLLMAYHTYIAALTYAGLMMKF